MVASGRSMVAGGTPQVVSCVAMCPLVIWDWNGTLLDDVEICVQSMNLLLGRRGLTPMTVDQYRSVFTFPVQRYYELVGFDFQSESFSDVALEYHEAYEGLVRRAKLHSDAIQALERLSAQEVSQVVLSALEERRLHNELRIRGIGHHFTHAFGLSDLHARSKAERGRELVAALESGTSVRWMIGDTDHDAEVAAEIGATCVLVSCGHHSYERLSRAGVPVVSNLTEAIAVIQNGLTR